MAADQHLEQTAAARRIELHVKGGGLVIALDPVKDIGLHVMEANGTTADVVIVWGSRSFARIAPYHYEEVLAISSLSSYDLFGTDAAKEPDRTVYSRAECSFIYCPTAAMCAISAVCQNPSRAALFIKEEPDRG